MLSRPLCLIAEDQSLIGFALEISLDEAGFGVVTSFPDNQLALAWLNRNQPNIALLDFMLRDGPCLPIARKLKARDIPFMIYSAMPPPTKIPDVLKGVPWVQKPTQETAIAELLRSQMKYHHA
ncbi:response regulator [Microvirga rosea]|uniref:histidine kinase n=1 Tax=Microvirga rosea TaxID=2715425 RepID=UPI001D0B4401|nr:histidine kinase [Microvirga rosea]MCB8820222.1 histidine kinase [Microvirga rosea]